MTWMNGLRATFDLETTGVDVTTARIVTASLILLDPQGNVVRRGEWLADPGVEIPAGAAAVHGITTEYAREHGRPAREVVWELAGAIGALNIDGVPIIAFNAAYDFSVLHHEMLRHNIANGELPPGVVLDPYVLHKHVIPRKRGKRTLEVLAAEYGVSLENAHTSADDALAAERLLVKLTEQFPEVLNVGCAPAARAADFSGRRSRRRASRRGCERSRVRNLRSLTAAGRCADKTAPLKT